MKTAFYTLPLLISVTASAWPNMPASVELKSGRYSCTLLNTDGPIRSQQPAELIFKRNSQSVSAVFVKPSGERIVGVKNNFDHSFLAVRGEVADLSSYSMDFTYGARPAPRFERIAWSVRKARKLADGGTKTSESKFDCVAAEEPVLLVSQPTYFDCQTGPLKGFSPKLSFGLYHMNESTLISFVADEDNDGEPVIYVSQSDSPLVSLNDNTDLILGRKGTITINGDADGIYSVSLTLDPKGGYTKGRVTYSDMDDENHPELSASVSCKVSNL